MRTGIFILFLIILFVSCEPQVKEKEKPKVVVPPTVADIAKKKLADSLRKYHNIVISNRVDTVYYPKNESMVSTDWHHDRFATVDSIGVVRSYHQYGHEIILERLFFPR